MSLKKKYIYFKYLESSNLTQQSFILGPVPAAANAPIVDIPGTSMELGPSDIGNEFFSNSGLQNGNIQCKNFRYKC